MKLNVFFRIVFRLVRLKGGFLLLFLLDVMIEMSD